MSYTSILYCCGIAELANICDDDSALDSIRAVKRGGETAFIIFSDTHRTGYKFGLRLAKVIETKKLGIVRSMPVQVNPNSGNRLRMWVWRVDWKRMRAVRAR